MRRSATSSADMLSKLVRSSGSAVRRSAAIAARSVGFAPPRLLCRRRGGADKGATHAGESLARSPYCAKRRGLGKKTLRGRRGGAFSGGPARTNQVAERRAPSTLWRRSCAVSSSLRRSRLCVCCSFRLPCAPLCRVYACVHVCACMCEW